MEDFVDFYLDRKEKKPKEKKSRLIDRISGTIVETKLGTMLITKEEDFLIEGAPEEAVNKKVTFVNSKIKSVKIFNKGTSKERKYRTLEIL